jgi:3D-(3,5/4)-trihydroxycyclohexane-1,2-dione acylhydrolase (decyclizing)
LFRGVFAIFGHGNVTCLSEALEAVQDELPTWRGQNEQSMALAAIAYAKAKKRRQIMIATSSIGPGATNMVTAAAVAHTNRLPVLLLSGDYYVSRAPDPVLQQVERFDDPTISVNDAFKPVTRYWDRITRPEQIIQSLPQAVATMLDPADCGPAFIGLCQDTQEIAFDYPAEFFEPVLHRIPRPRPDTRAVADAAAALRGATRPLIISGGGVRYSGAGEMLAGIAEARGIPMAETIAGKSAVAHDHPAHVGPIGVIGSSSANAMAEAADLVLAVGTRLQDFTTGSWTAFAPDARFVSINTARWDATKHRALAVVGDARETRGRARCRPWRLAGGPGAYGAGAGAVRRLEPAGRRSSGHDQRARADLCAGRRPGERRRPAERHAGCSRRRAAGRGGQGLAREGSAYLRLRVRVQLHGIRDPRRLGSCHGKGGRGNPHRHGR